MKLDTQIYLLITAINTTITATISQARFSTKLVPGFYLFSLE